jgi:hypothetical protein
VSGRSSGERARPLERSAAGWEGADGAAKVSRSAYVSATAAPNHVKMPHSFKLPAGFFFAILARP